MKIEKKQNRRIFFRNSMRMIIAAGLGVVSTSLLLKQSSGEACSYNFVCSRCLKQASCPEPEAELFRKSVREKTRKPNKPHQPESSARAYAPVPKQIEHQGNKTI